MGTLGGLESMLLLVGWVWGLGLGLRIFFGLFLF